MKEMKENERRRTRMKENERKRKEMKNMKENETNDTKRSERKENQVKKKAGGAPRCKPGLTIVPLMCIYTVC
jgi:hypothetical protein